MIIIKSNDLILTFLLCQFMNAQNEGVEKSNSTIQIGFVGVWINRESRFSNELSLRTGIGFDGGIRGVVLQVKQL
jgi:hypothetical protein